MVDFKLLSCVFLCLCNNEREIKSFFSVCKFARSRERSVSVSLKTCSYISVRMCFGRERGVNEREPPEERQRRTLNTKWKKKVNDFKNVTSVRIFSGIFLTMHLASCYSFEHTLNSCFVLCCKQFLKNKRCNLSVCKKKTKNKTKGHVKPGQVHLFCLLKEIRSTLCIVQYMETTQDMFIPQINIEIFFSLTRVSWLFLTTKPHWNHFNGKWH